MENTETLIVLLTIAVILLSIVIVSLLTITILVLVKLRKIAQNIDRISNNVASASDWLSPAKLFGELARAFRR